MRSGHRLMPIIGTRLVMLALFAASNRLSPPLGVETHEYVRPADGRCSAFTAWQAQAATLDSIRTCLHAHRSLAVLETSVDLGLPKRRLAVVELPPLRRDSATRVIYNKVPPGTGVQRGRSLVRVPCQVDRPEPGEMTREAISQSAREWTPVPVRWRLDNIAELLVTSRNWTVSHVTAPCLSAKVAIETGRLLSPCSTLCSCVRPRAKRAE